MAESATFAANLQYHPSIFEITAAEFLDNILYPALSKVCNFFGWELTINSRYFKYNEDISPAITLALQYYYLKKNNSSFGENFYGLQRINNNGKPFQKHFTSALLLILLPFIEKKLKTRASNHENESRLEKVLLNGFYIYQVLRAINILTYLAKLSSTHSPILKIFNLKLAYSPPEVEKASIVLKSIELFAFFLQFMQWWYSKSDRKNIGNLKNPPFFENKEINLLSLNCKEMCPICLQKLAIPTASSISGYVYCWKCIASHLKDKKRCPVSGLPMNIEDLVRIYDS